jgi:hypothetical protein
MTNSKFKILILNIIRKKKAVYYSLFSVFLSFLLYFTLASLINIANTQPIFPFLLLSLGLLLIILSRDIYDYEKKLDLSFKLSFLITLTSSILITFSSVFGLITFLLINFSFIITIFIHFIALVLMYYVLQKEIKKYYNLKIKEPKNEKSI